MFIDELLLGLIEYSILLLLTLDLPGSVWKMYYPHPPIPIASEPSLVLPEDQIGIGEGADKLLVQGPALPKHHERAVDALHDRIIC